MHMKVGISNTMQVNHNESNDVFLATIKEDQISVYQNIPPIYYRSLEFVHIVSLPGFAVAHKKFAHAKKMKT